MRTFAVIMLVWGVAEGIDDCAVLQAREPRAPCYLYITPSLISGRKPDFVYDPLLPGPTPESPCPVLQTLRATDTCYTKGSPVNSLGDVPAYYLTVPLPPYADDERVLVAKLKSDKTSTPRPLISDSPQSSSNLAQPKPLPKNVASVYGIPRAQ